MGWDETSESVCPVARGLSIFGDRWTLLIMREVGMGVRRFEDIQAQTGMSSNLLAMRLKRLEEDGIIERRQYSSHASRFEYHATQKGKELDAVLLSIRAWSMRWGGFPPGSDPAVTLVFKETGETIDALWQMPRGKKLFSFDDTEGVMSMAFAREREARVAAFKASRGKSVEKEAKTPVAKGPKNRHATAAQPVRRTTTARKLTAKPGPSKALATEKKKAAAPKRTTKAV